MDHEKICAEYYGFIYHQCLQKLKDENLAKDAAQTVILIYLQKKNSFDERVILSTWFLNTSRNVCFWFFKEQKKGRKMETLASAAAVVQETTPSTNIEEKTILKEKLHLALNEISPYHRSILMSLYYENKTFNEIGKQFKKGENTIRKASQVAENQLKKVLNQKYQGLFNLTIDSGLFSILKEIPFKPELSFLKLNAYQTCATGVLKMVLIQKVILVVTCFTVIGASGYGLTKYTYANVENNNKTEVVETKKDITAKNEMDVLKKMEQPVFFDFTNTGFKDGLNQLGALANITIVFDKVLFTTGGVDPDAPIQMVANGMSFKNALKWILANVNADYSIKDQTIYISAKK